MNCSEYQYMLTGPLLLWERTVAERGAMTQHYESCEECRKFLDDLASEEEGELSPEDEEAAVMLRLEDEADPEYR